MKKEMLMEANLRKQTAKTLAEEYNAKQNSLSHLILFSVVWLLILLGLVSGYNKVAHYFAVEKKTDETTTTHRTVIASPMMPSVIEEDAEIVPTSASVSQTNQKKMDSISAQSQGAASAKN